MKVTKRELIKIWNTLEGLNGSDYGRKFSYGIVRNKKLFRDEIEALQEAQTPTPEYQKYDVERIALCAKYADKDEAGQPLRNKGQFVFTNTEAIQQLNEEMKKLVETHAPALADFEKKDKEFEDVLNEEVEFDVYQMDLDVFPEEIDPGILEVLDVFIKEE